MQELLSQAERQHISLDVDLSQPQKYNDRQRWFVKLADGTTIDLPKVPSLPQAPLKKTHVKRQGPREKTNIYKYQPQP